jgi:hypothetical protein
VVVYGYDVIKQNISIGRQNSNDAITGVFGGDVKGKREYETEWNVRIFIR